MVCPAQSKLVSKQSIERPKLPIPGECRQTRNARREKKISGGGRRRDDLKAAANDPREFCGVNGCANLTRLQHKNHGDACGQISFHAFRRNRFKMIGLFDSGSLMRENRLFSDPPEVSAAQGKALVSLVRFRLHVVMCRRNRATAICKPSL
jgi:hypothetical protein